MKSIDEIINEITEQRKRINRRNALIEEAANISIFDKRTADERDRLAHEIVKLTNQIKIFDNEYGFVNKAETAETIQVEKPRTCIM